MKYLLLINLIAFTLLISHAQENPEWKKHERWEYQELNGRKHGQYIAKHIDSEVIGAIGTYDNGNYTGDWIYFDNSGQLQFTLNNIELNQEVEINNLQSSYKPKFIALVTNYYKNGKIESQGKILFTTDPELDLEEYGDWIYYNEVGSVKKEKTFELSGGR